MATLREVHADLYIHLEAQKKALDAAREDHESFLVGLRHEEEVSQRVVGQGKIDSLAEELAALDAVVLEYKGVIDRLYSIIYTDL